MSLSPTAKIVFHIVILFLLINFKTDAYCYEPILVEEESRLLNALRTIVDQGTDSGILRKEPHDDFVAEDATMTIMLIQLNWDKWSPAFREAAGAYLLVKPSGLEGRTSIDNQSDGQITLSVSKGSNSLFRKNVRGEQHMLPNWVETLNFNIEWGNGLGGTGSGKSSDKIVDCSQKLLLGHCSGLPDIIYRWVEYFEDAWSIETNLGFDRPSGTGSYLLDIYIGNSQDDVKYNNDDKTPGIGDNLLGFTSTYCDVQNSCKTDWSSSSSYIVVNNHVTDSEAMKSTSAHEFFHAIQFSYPTIDAWFSNDNHWWIEATATWMEEIVHDDANQYYDRIGNWLRAPWLSLKYSGNRYTDHEYGDALFVIFMTEVYLKDMNFVKYVWENKDSGIRAINNVLSDSYNKGNFESAFKEFVALNALTASSYTGRGYEEGVQYGRVAVAKIHNQYPVSLNITDGTAPQELGSNYIHFIPSDVNENDLIIEFDGSDNNWAAMVVKIHSDGSGYETEEIALNQYNKYGCHVISGFGTIYSEVFLVPVILIDPELINSAQYYYHASLNSNSVCSVIPDVYLMQSDSQSDAVIDKSKSDKRCFIATAAFGSPDSPYVKILRDFRDEYLIPYGVGRRFVEMYYRISPSIADFLEHNPPAPLIVRVLLFPAICVAFFLLNTSFLFFGFGKIVILCLLCLILFLCMKYLNVITNAKTTLEKQLFP